MIRFFPCENVNCRTLSIKVSFWSDRLLADHGSDRGKLLFKRVRCDCIQGLKIICTPMYIKLTDFALCILQCKGTLHFRVQPTIFQHSHRDICKYNMVVYPDTLEDCLCITNYTADFLHVWFRRRKFLLTENKSKVEFSTTDLSLLVRTLGAGAQATDPVSTVSECVYTQQQPIVRRRILSVKIYSDFITLSNP